MNRFGLKQGINTLGLGSFTAILIEAGRRVVSVVKRYPEIAQTIKTVSRQSVLRKISEPVSIVKSYFKRR